MKFKFISVAILSLCISSIKTSFGTIIIDTTTRTVESTQLKIIWDLDNPEMIKEVYFKPFSSTVNLTDFGAICPPPCDTEFTGNSHAPPDPQSGGIVLVGRGQVGTWDAIVSSDGSKAQIIVSSIGLIGLPVTTTYCFTADSPIIRVDRTFFFSQVPLDRDFRPYMWRASPYTNFFRTAHPRMDGSVALTNVFPSCPSGCEVVDWQHTWADVEDPNRGMGIAVFNASFNPSSDLWLDFDDGSGSSYASALVQVPAGGFNSDLQVTYAYFFHLGDYLTGNVVETFQNYDFLLDPCESILSLVMPVDIKPQSCPNPLNTKSKGVLPVAILGTELLDANEIDLSTVRLQGVAPLRSALEDVATPVERVNPCDCATEGPDGFVDLTLKFDTQEIVRALGDVNDREVFELTLTANLIDGTVLENTDCIIILEKEDHSKPVLATIESSNSESIIFQPNPFSSSTIIRFERPTTPSSSPPFQGGEKTGSYPTELGVGEGGLQNVHLAIYDISGRLVRSLVDKEHELGNFTIEWDGRDEMGREVVSGVYFFHLSGEKFENIQKVILLR